MSFWSGIKQLENMDILFQKVLDSISEAAIVVDQAGLIIFANKSYKNVVGVDGKLVIGKPLPKVEPSAFLNKVILTGEPIIEAYNRLDKAGIDILTNAYPVVSKNRVIGGVGIFCKSDTLKRPLTNPSIIQNADIFSDLVGEDPLFKKSVEKAINAARSCANILLMGESGVGKGVFVKTIHNLSQRSEGPFVAVNCASIPENLLESELFGYVGGAFTGARREGKKGKFELAHGGTLFLDEIGDMSLSMQAKLLVAIQDKEIEPVGGTKRIPVDIRIIAATNKDLKKMIEKKEFREDLYYRLNVIPITIPPLRERSSDVLLLIRYFLNRHCSIHGKNLVIPIEIIEKLTAYPWPGNVRELSNAIEYAVVMCSKEKIMAWHFPEDIAQYLEINVGSRFRNTPVLNNLIRNTEYNAIKKALEEANGNKTVAMNMLGMSRKTFYDRLKKYNLI